MKYTVYSNWLSLYSLNMCFIKKYKEILCKKSVLGENQICMLWHQTSRNYGRISVKLDSGVTKTVYAHRLSYFLSKSDICGLFNQSTTHEVSHLCHNTLCVNADHLSFEPSKINSERKICVNSRICKHHEGFSDCLLHLKL